VDGAVERAVAAAVKPMPHGVAAAGGQRTGPGECGERGVAATPAGIGEADDGLRGGDGADAPAVGQAWGDLVDDRLELRPVGLERTATVAQRRTSPRILSRSPVGREVTVPDASDPSSSTWRQSERRERTRSRK
jgi:hypothetical protein